jgi:nucleoside-triphosphatase
MPQNYFITGLPKAGKTTLLRTIIAKLKSRGLYVGGFISPEEKHSGKRTGFLVQDIESGRTGMLADIAADGPKVSKYHVDIGSFETIAMMSLSGFERYDVIVIDEIGWMESKSRIFLDKLDDLLDSRTVVIASLNADFVDKYSSTGKVYEMSQANRQFVYNEILTEIKGIGKKSALPKAERKAPAKRKPEAVEERPKKAAPVKSPSKKEMKAGARKAKAEKATVPKKEGKTSLGEAGDKEGAQEIKVEEKKSMEKKREEKKKGILDKLKGLLGF